MKLFVFKIHEDCEYVDGAILIIARSYERAIQIYKNERRKKRNKHSFYENPIFEQRPEKLEEYMRYDYPWYLAYTLELEDNSSKEGILLTAYHDG